MLYRNCNLKKINATRPWSKRGIASVVSCVDLKEC